MEIIPCKLKYLLLHILHNGIIDPKKYDSTFTSVLCK